MQNVINNNNLLLLCLSDGPLIPTITGQYIVLAKFPVTLICSASSQPPSTYSWMFDDSVVATGAIYEIPSVEMNQSGEYTCQAHNNVTGMTGTVKYFLLVVCKLSYYTNNKVSFFTYTDHTIILIYITHTDQAKQYDQLSNTVLVCQNSPLTVLYCVFGHLSIQTSFTLFSNLSHSSHSDHTGQSLILKSLFSWLWEFSLATFEDEMTTA